MSFGKKKSWPGPYVHAAVASTSWGQYYIDLPGSLQTNKIPVILGRYCLLGLFYRTKNCSSVWIGTMVALGEIP